MTAFQPDYRHLQAAAQNKRPARLPVYEHIFSTLVMEQILDLQFASLFDGDDRDLTQYFSHYCRFFVQMTYDAVPFEACITSILPDGGAICGGRPGPIQNRRDFQQYPWDTLPDLFWSYADRLFQALTKSLPPGMKIVGGIGNGPFEISEDLVGLEYLAYMQADDPNLFADLYVKIGDLLLTIWRQCLQKYQQHFAVCRFGDDLGFKNSTLTSPANIRAHVIPQYRPVIDLVHQSGLPFLWHSCGNIFSVMEDAIAAGINAKHSNEDVIAPFDRWIELYGNRIGLFGGIDVDLLCTQTPDVIGATAAEAGARFRQNAAGFALGSGNSIPDYVPPQSYLALIQAARDIRQREAG